MCLGFSNIKETTNLSQCLTFVLHNYWEKKPNQPKTKLDMHVFSGSKPYPQNR